MAAQHILIPIHDFSAGGTELVAFRLAQAWIAMGRQVTVLAGASDGPLRPRAPDGVAVHILSPERPRSTFSRMFLGSKMAQVAAKLAPDAIFIPGSFHFGLGRAFRGALPHVAIVAKVSNPIVDDGMPTALRPIARIVVGRLTRGIDRLVAMAPALVQPMSAYVDRQRIAVIHDPFLDDDARIAPRSGPVHTPGEPLRLLFVGRLEPQKDPALALDVMASLRQRGFPATLTMLGGGPMEAELRARLTREGLSDAVNIAGYVADTSGFYRASDLLLMTSRFEGVPAVIGEALVHGLPFVATPCTPWLTALAHNHPALGVTTTDRTGAALADAIVSRASRPFPDGQEIERGIGVHRMSASASAYLTLFDQLVEARKGQDKVNHG